MTRVPGVLSENVAVMHTMLWRTDLGEETAMADVDRLADAFLRASRALVAVAARSIEAAAM